MFETQVFGLGDEFVIVCTEDSGDEFIIYKYRKPYISAINMNSEYESIPIVGEEFLTHPPHFIDISVDFKCQSILSDGNPGYEYVSGTGDWKKFLNLSLDSFTIQDLFKAINSKIEKEKKNTENY